jgi:glutaredoxin 3
MVMSGSLFISKHLVLLFPLTLPLLYVVALQVMVFAKSYCPYCKKTKSLLMELEEYIEVGVEWIDLDDLPGSDGPMIQKELQVISGQRTVPNVFIGQEHIGGNSDLQQLHAMGKLEGLLMEVSRASEL